MNQNFCNSNSFGFNQTQPPQFPVIHPPPQETSNKNLHDQENELAEYINTPGWNRHAFYHDDDDDDVDYTIAITPVLSTEEPVDSLSMGNEHLDTILATESDEVIKSSVKDLVQIQRSDDGSLYNMNIEYVEASPHDFEVIILEVAEIVIPGDEEIEDDNLREKFGSTTTHSDISLSEYDSFIFDLSNDQFPPTDRSNFTHEEFADELTHIISPPEYDRFYFWNLSDPGSQESVSDDTLSLKTIAGNSVSIDL
nr:hypothetical protein [Tanacetum cinerariifolium]